MASIRRLLGIAFLVLLVVTAVQVNLSFAAKNTKLKSRVTALEQQVASLQAEVQAVRSSVPSRLDAQDVITTVCADGDPAVWASDPGPPPTQNRVHLSC